MPFPPGTVLAGKYRVDRLLGEGGMGWVVVATHLQLEQRVALKFMRTTHAMPSSEAIRRFIREARAAARIQSEHVARVSDVGTLDNGAPYLVMEYLEGRDLDSLLRATPQLPVSLAIEYAMQACEGLSEVHAAGIVHRDLKPANLFLARRTDGTVRVKLLDFGISKVAVAPGGIPDGAMTSTQSLMGSPLYMAPEQMRSSKSVDARADIWSMGVIVYEMLAGRSPFFGDTLPEVCARIIADPPAPLHAARPDVTFALEAVIMHCLEKEPGQRFQDVSELARALAAFGQAEARTTADRVERVVRGSPSTSSDRSAESAESTRPPRRHEVAHTAAAFGIAEAEPASRRSVALSLAVGAIVLMIAGLAAVLAARETHGGSSSASAPLIQSPPANESSSPSSMTAPELPPPSDLVEPSAVASAPSTATPAVRPEASAAALARTHGKRSPAPAPAAAPSVKPAPTTGFGGRD